MTLKKRYGTRHLLKFVKHTLTELLATFQPVRSALSSFTAALVSFSSILHSSFVSASASPTKFCLVYTLVVKNKTKPTRRSTFSRAKLSSATA
jgi:hypothetical protein